MAYVSDSATAYLDLLLDCGLALPVVQPSFAIKYLFTARAQGVAQDLVYWGHSGVLNTRVVAEYGPMHGRWLELLHLFG